MLRETKTSGPTKQVKELPVCVSEKAFFARPEWLKVGFELLKSHVSKQLRREMWRKNQVAFSVVGDISKAHRRFKHAAREHGYLGCRLGEVETVAGEPSRHLWSV